MVYLEVSWELEAAEVDAELSAPHREPLQVAHLQKKYVWYKMLSSSLDALLKSSKTKFSKKNYSIMIAWPRTQ